MKLDDIISILEDTCNFITNRSHWTEQDRGIKSRLLELLNEAKDSKISKRYLIEEQARYCTRCGQQMFYDDIKDICGTCVEELKYSRHKVNVDISDSDWIKPLYK